MEFCERLQGLRKERSMTQEELAEKLNVSRQAVSKWESGQAMPEIDKLVQMTQLFDVPLDYLVRGLRDEVEPCGEVVGTDTVKDKKVSKGFIFGIVAFMLGFLGVLVFCVLCILDNYSSFVAFLSDHEMWALFITCCFFSFLGIVMVFKDGIGGFFAKISNAYKRQSRVTKVGFGLSLLGGVMVFVLRVVLLNIGTYQKIHSATDNVIRVHYQVNPMLYLLTFFSLIFSLIILVSGIVMMVMGVVKKAKNK